MKRQSLFFDGPGRMAIREEPIPEPSETEVLVRTIVSAVSAGSELLVYRDQVPPNMAVDATIESLRGTFAFPMKYGYACVGEVISLGRSVDPLWQGRKVFSFQPHQNCFITKVSDLFPLPPGVDVLDAVFLPFMETAITLLLDGQPSMGEQVAVFGQGVVGLLVTALLGRIPLSRLLTLDLHTIRRRTSEQLGAHRSVDPNETPIEEILAFLQGAGDYQGADLTFELSGSPAALDQAIAVTGYSGRVVIGSWYGSKEVTIHPGGSFHRSRIKIISSQVSSIEPGLRGRWTKDRTLGLAWRFLEEIKPSRLITHTFPFSEAEKAYHLLDKNPGECLQVVLTY